MDYLSRVDELQSSQELIQEKLVVFISEGLAALNDLSEICIHELGYDIAEYLMRYTSSKSSLDLGRSIVSIFTIFSCLSSL